MRLDREFRKLTLLSGTLAALIAALGVLFDVPYMLAASLLLMLSNIATLLGAILTTLIEQHDRKDTDE